MRNYMRLAVADGRCQLVAAVMCPRRESGGNTIGHIMMDECVWHRTKFRVSLRGAKKANNSQVATDIEHKVKYPSSDAPSREHQGILVALATMR